MVADYLQHRLTTVAMRRSGTKAFLASATRRLTHSFQPAKSYEFAILVVTPDDLVQKRSDTAHAPRDNLVFEIGMSMGSLGRERTFVVH